MLPSILCDICVTMCVVVLLLTNQVLFHSQTKLKIVKLRVRPCNATATYFQGTLFDCLIRLSSSTLAIAVRESLMVIESRKRKVVDDHVIRGVKNTQMAEN